MWLLGLVPMFRKHGKALVVVSLLVGVFAAGWKANGWRLEEAWQEERARRAEAVATAIAERETLIRAEWDARLVIVKQQRNDLLDTTLQIREERDALKAEIDSAALIKPELVVCDVTGEVENEPQNPFSDGFVDLWNRGLRND